MSYTEFEYSAISLNAPQLAAGETLEVSLTISNTGPVAGVEVVQLYVQDLSAEKDRPSQALKGFEKCHIEQGESHQITLNIPVEELAIFSPESGEWFVKRGDYRVLLGSSSRDIRQQAAFSVV